MRGYFVHTKSTKIDVLPRRYPLPYSVLLSVFGLCDVFQLHMCILRGSYFADFSFFHSHCCTNKLHAVFFIYIKT